VNCPNCGQPYPADAKYCSSCGAALGGASAPGPRRRVSKLAVAAFAASLVAGMWLWADEGRSRAPFLVVLCLLGVDFVALAVTGWPGRAVRGQVFAGLGFLFLLFCLVIAPHPDWDRPKRREANCKANLESIWRALDGWRWAPGGQFPPADQWCDALLEGAYLSDESSLVCPAQSPSVRCSYAINSRVAGTHVDKTSRRVLLFEINGGWNVSGGPERMIAKPRHPGGFMFLLVNGQVTVVPEDELGQVSW